MTFQRAPPDVNGFGVITETPGLVRSSHVLIFFGLPSRTAKTTTEFVTIPLYDCLFHFESTSPAFTSVSTSGARDRYTMSALRPALTARAWSPEAPYDCVKRRPLPAGVLSKAVISLPSASRGVEYATRLSLVSDVRADAVAATTSTTPEGKRQDCGKKATSHVFLQFSTISIRVMEISRPYGRDKRFNMQERPSRRSARPV